MPVPVGRFLRTSAYGALTFAGSHRLARIGERRLGRLALRATQRALSGGWVKVPGGAGFGLRLSTEHLPIAHHQGYGLIRGVLEPGVQEALRREVRPGAVVYDIGANIGFFSLLSARLAGPDGRVEAFEPVPASAMAVRANAALNGFPTIAVHNVAVSDRHGSGTFLVPVESGWSHLADRGWHESTRRQLDVALVALDDQIARELLPPPDVVKIDVEGSEIAVLRGLSETLRSRSVVIVCELHETNVEILELMHEIGYAVENLDGTEPVAYAGPIHVLARPRVT
jgi:FkbM family methyltransferase